MTNTELRTATFTALHSGSIVKWDVPRNAALRQLKDPDGAVALDYLQWAVPLPGGVVNMQVHTSDASIKNSTIRAMVEIKIKTTAIGRPFLTVDLHPVDDETEVTHRLVILRDAFDKMDGWLVFPAPNLGGFAALIAPDEKLVEPPVKYRDGKSTPVDMDPSVDVHAMAAVSAAVNRPFASALAGMAK